MGDTILSLASHDWDDALYVSFQSKTCLVIFWNMVNFQNLFSWIPFFAKSLVSLAGDSGWVIIMANVAFISLLLWAQMIEAT